MGNKNHYKLIVNVEDHALERYHEYVGPASRAQVAGMVRRHLFEALKESLVLDKTGAGHVGIKKDLVAVVVPRLEGGWSVITFHRKEYIFGWPERKWTDVTKDTEVVNEHSCALIWAPEGEEFHAVPLQDQAEAAKIMERFKETGQFYFPHKDDIYIEKQTDVLMMVQIQEEVRIKPDDLEKKEEEE